MVNKRNRINRVSRSDSAKIRRQDKRAYSGALSDESWASEVAVRRVSPKPKIIKAKFPSNCSTCLSRIRVGDLISLVFGSPNWVHQDCLPEVVTRAAVLVEDTAIVDPANPYSWGGSA